jgi:hypothetical protein
MKIAWNELIITTYISTDMYMTLIDLDLYLNNEKPTSFMIEIYGRGSFPLSLGLYEEDVKPEKGVKEL